MPNARCGCTRRGARGTRQRGDGSGRSRGGRAFQRGQCSRLGVPTRTSRRALRRPRSDHGNKQKSRLAGRAGITVAGCGDPQPPLRTQVRRNLSPACAHGLQKPVSAQHVRNVGLANRQRDHAVPHSILALDELAANRIEVALRAKHHPGELAPSGVRIIRYPGEACGACCVAVAWPIRHAIQGNGRSCRREHFGNGTDRARWRHPT